MLQPTRVRTASDSHCELAVYVWCRDGARAPRTTHQIECGWVQVNQGLGQSPGMRDSFTQRNHVTANLAF
jgi:betaine-aldehyde dehydrogenase